MNNDLLAEFEDAFEQPEKKSALQPSKAFDERPLTQGYPNLVVSESEGYMRQYDNEGRLIYELSDNNVPVVDYVNKVNLWGDQNPAPGLSNMPQPEPSPFKEENEIDMLFVKPEQAPDNIFNGSIDLPVEYFESFLRSGMKLNFKLKYPNEQPVMKETETGVVFYNDKGEVKLEVPIPRITDYSSMPLGLKEAQQRNGVFDHGLDVVTVEINKDNAAKEIPPLPPEWNVIPVNHTQKVVKGDFVEIEDNKVIWKPSDTGTFSVVDPNNINAATKSFIDRKFPGKFYYGTGEALVYDTWEVVKHLQKAEPAPQPEVAPMNVVEAHEHYLKNNKGHVSFKKFERDIYPGILNPAPEPAPAAPAPEEVKPVEPTTPFTGFGAEWLQSLDKMEEVFHAAVPEEQRGPTIILAGAIAPGIPSESMVLGVDTVQQLPLLPVNSEINFVGGIDPARELMDKGTVAVLTVVEEGKIMQSVVNPQLDFEKEVEKVAEYYNAKIEEELPPAPFGVKQKIWVGIDPGKDGGIVAITQQGIVSKRVIPLIGKDIDPQALSDHLLHLGEKYDVTVILEDVHSLHKMAAATNFSMGHTLGIILGIVVASRLRLIRVQPKAWQKEIWQNSEIEFLPKKPDQVNPSVNTKLTSMKAARRLFPHTDFRKSERATKPHDGICDACCLAEFGRRKNL